MSRLLTCLCTVFVLLPASAEEPTLPTIAASELLGEDLMGLPMPDAHMWSGTLFELASATAALELETSSSGIPLGHGIRDYRSNPLPALMGLHRHDVIQSFDGLPLDSTAALHDMIRALAGQESVTLEIRRGNGIVTRRVEIPGDPVEPEASWFVPGRTSRRMP